MGNSAPKVFDGKKGKIEFINIKYAINFLI